MPSRASPASANWTRQTLGGSRSTPPVAEATLARSVPTRASRRRRSRAREAKISVGGLAQRIADIEARLTGAAELTSGAELSDDVLATVAHRIYQARRRRARFLPAGVLGEPGWDILLDHFVATVRCKRVRTTSASLASRASGTTGLRWLAVLETHGLIERCAEFGDRRVRLVRLTQRGYRSMRAYLIDGVDAAEFPFRR